MSNATRRDALKLIGAAGVTATTTASQATTKVTPAKVDAVISVTPLGFPWHTIDPFLFCVHHDDHYPAGNDSMGPAVSLAGRNLGQDFEGKDGWRMYHGEVVPGFPQHPHRGFETVTVVRKGLLDHSDSLGATARYGGGDVQWLTAGKGIQHAEMFPLIDRKDANHVELFQIWLNLPSADKMVDPFFAMFWNQSIPRHRSIDSSGRKSEIALVAGRYGKLHPPSPPPKSWAARPDSDVAIWTIKMDPGARFTLPAATRGTNRSLYFFRGSGLRVGGQEIPPVHQALLRADAEVVLEGGGENRSDETEILVLQGRPIGEPVVQHGPFVMNTDSEIRQAFADYRRTQFGGWPWSSPDPVHPRDQDRFARHIGGRLDRPV